MDNVFFDNFTSFFMERNDLVEQKLRKQEQYADLINKKHSVLKELLGDDPEARRKYSIYENIVGEVMGIKEMQLYIQGIQDAMMFKQMLS